MEFVEGLRGGRGKGWYLYWIANLFVAEAVVAVGVEGAAGWRAVGA